MVYTREELVYLRRKKINPAWFEKTYENVKKVFGDDARITSAERHDNKKE